MLIPIKLMQAAILEAKAAYLIDEVPVGAVISDNDGNIIARSHNKTRTLCDPTAHAEIQVIRAACKKLKTTNLSNYNIFSTLEPCSMCASAIATAKISKIYFGLYDEKFGGVVSGTQILYKKNAYPKIEIYPEMLSESAKILLQKFFITKR
ncbi:MAG: nucleoside deaminase [Rickettsiales bacterium]|jgi:tRNA(adenine34) deaminase|nr:nucleoside deaminase [Rickettsiales bacterium]